MKPRALYYRMLQYQPHNLQLLNDAFELVELDTPQQDTPAIMADIEVLFAPLGYPVTPQRMDQAPQLKAIVSNTTSVPHIDLDEARARGVAVYALHDEQAFLETITPTAELTIGLMVAACRRIPAAHGSVLEGRWNRRPWGAPRMLSRLRLGIVGLGRLGRQVARTATAMGMAVDYYDPFVDGGSDDLHTLAARSDVLSLHAPGSRENRGLVSRQVLEAMPAGGVVINTGRGELLDTEALLDLLESGHLWAAALDTIDGEFAPDFENRLADSRLLAYARSHDNLILTPHIGGSTVDAWGETERHVIVKACRLLGLSVST